MDIVVCTDKNYIIPCGVMICSICENNKDSAITFHVIIDHSLNIKHKESLERITNKYSEHSKNILFYQIDGDSMLHFPRLDDSNPKNYITKAAYYNLFITALLPDNIEKVLYLDCDTIIRHSIKALWEIDLGHKSVAVVPDVAEGIIDKYNRLRYPQTKGYFNSGVILINLKKWRKENKLLEFTNFIDLHPDWIKFHDQDVLNRVFFDDNISLPIKYNFQEGFLWKEQFYDYWKYEKEVLEAREDPVIIHFTDSKPWNEDCYHPWKEEFFKYKIKTEWADTPIISNNSRLPFRRKLKNKIRKVLEILGILTPFPTYPSKYI